MSLGTREYAEPKPGPGATRFSIGDDRFVVSALIAGDGLDLVVHGSRSHQLTCAEARELADALLKAAAESPNL